MDVKKLNPIELDGVRIQLLPVGNYGFEDFYEYSVNLEFYKHIEYDGFTSRKQVVDYLNKMIKRSEDDDSQYWFIRLKETGKIIGTFCVLDYDPRRASSEIGYGISPDYWGKGYFSEALDVALNYLFDKLSLHRVFAKTMETNKASIVALQKKGFVKEGVARDFYKFMDGNWVSACFLSILSTDYKN